MAQRSSDAPQNLEEMYRWRAQKDAYTCDNYYLEQVNRKWRQLGRLVKGPACLRNAENHN